MFIGSKPNTSRFISTLFMLLALVGGDENVGETGGVTADDDAPLGTKQELVLLLIPLEEEEDFAL